MKNKKTAGLLALILGIFGIHRFYLRQYVRGAFYIIFPALLALLVALLTGTVEILKDASADLNFGPAFLNRIFFVPIVYYLPVLLLSIAEAIYFFVMKKEHFNKHFNGQHESSAKVWGFSILNIALSILVLFLLFNRYFSKDSINVSGTDAAFEITSTDLFAAFDEDADAAYAKYGNQVIDISGNIVEVGQEITGEYYVSLEGGIIYNVKCNFQASEQEKVKDLVEGQEITVKGYCRALIMDLIVDDCQLVNIGEKPAVPEPEPVTDSLSTTTDTL